MQKEKLNKNVNILISLLYYVSVAATSFLLLKYVVPLFTPFLISFTLTFFIHPISNNIAKKTKLNIKFCRIFIVLFVFFVVVLSIFLVGFKIVAVLKDIVNSSDEIYEKCLVPIEVFIKNNVVDLINKILPNSNINYNEFLDSLTKSINNFINSNSKHILNIIAKFGTTIPEFFVDLAFFIISAIYFSYDYEKITNFIISLFPKKIKKILLKTKNKTISVIIKCIKSCVLLMIICFLLFVVGFLIIKIKNPIGTAAIVAFFDVIPFFGSGLIILPWVIYLLVTQKFALGIAILAIFLIISLLRSFLEANILGTAFEIHPVATLITIYFGAKTFGVLGMVCAPVLLPILYAAFKNKKIKK